MKACFSLTARVLAAALGLIPYAHSQVRQPQSSVVAAQDMPQFEQQPLLDRLENGAPGAAGTAQQRAPIDLTCYWASVVTEDWRWRMLTAPKGDYASVPLNGEGRRVASLFDPQQYAPAWSSRIDCRAYGAAGIMRMPTRLHISWAQPEVMRLDTDWGQQTRLFYFDPKDAPSAAAPSTQGR